MEAQVAAMNAQVELETKAIAEVQAAKLEEDAECHTRSKEVEDVLKSETKKATQRAGELAEICDTAEQRKALLGGMVNATCSQVPPEPEPQLTTMEPVVPDDEQRPVPAPAPGDGPAGYSAPSSAP